MYVAACVVAVEVKRNVQLLLGATLKQLLASCVTSASETGKVAAMLVAVVVLDVLLMTNEPEVLGDSNKGEPVTVIRAPGAVLLNVKF